MATRSINVKIPTVKVIASLETKLAELKAVKEEYPARRAQYEKDLSKWNDQVFALVGKPQDISVSDYSSYMRRDNEYEVVVRYNVSKSKGLPEKPQAPSDFGYMEREAVENIENALRILKLTEQEEVSTSTYNAVAKYL
jgi:hypothetical protein